MRRNGVADHVQDGDFLQGGLGARDVHEARAELRQQGVAVLSGVQHGGVGLRESLDGRVHLDVHLHGVGEVIGLEDGREGEGAFRGDGHLEGTGEGGAGLHGHGKLLLAGGGAQDQQAGDGRFGDAGDAEGGLIDIAHIEEAGLLDGYLHRQRNHHLLLQEGVPHGGVVRVNAYVIGGQLVRCTEAHLQGAVGGGPQLRLEGEGAGEDAADVDIGKVHHRTVGLFQIDKLVIIQLDAIIHDIHGIVGRHGRGGLHQYHAFRAGRGFAQHHAAHTAE